jgi:hypothetical protein
MKGVYKMEITVNGLNKQIKATKEQIFSVCNKCSSSDLYCDWDLEIEKYNINCWMLACKLKEKR